MNRAPRLAVAAIAVSVLGLLPRSGRAESPNAKTTQMYVLPVSTDDADDQADALTQALRARVRQTPGYALLEAAQSFETLSIALKCPPKPDQSCLERIGDQLHADRYVWGTMTRRKGPREVVAELHLWTRGETGSDATESYGDNLKDPGSDSLRAIALRLFSKLRGAGAAGTLVILAGKSSGTVVIDGVEKGALDNGLARIEVPAGSHSVAVRVAGFNAPAQTAEVLEGSEKDITFQLVGPRPVVTRIVREEQPQAVFPIGKVLGYSALIVGAGLLVAGGVEAVAWFNDNDASTNDRKSVPKSVSDVCSYPGSLPAQDACSKSKDALTASTLGWVFAGAGVVLAGVGVFLLVTENAADTPRRASRGPAPPALKPTVELLPAFGPHAGSLDLRVTF